VRRPALSAAASIAILASLGAAQAQRADPPASCAALTALTIPATRIVSAVAVDAGPFTAPGTKSATTLPAFCRVVAVATPSADSHVNFEVWLPRPDAWTGRFMAFGNNGFAGNIEYAAMGEALMRGDAAVSSDTGHTGGELLWAQGHPEKVIDWAHRAVHVTAETAKRIVRNYEGRFPDYSYFDGCNTGGHQALSEVQRYPADFDGVIAGSPANDRINEIAAYLFVWKATHRDGVNILPAAKLHLLGGAVINACDGLDGVKDGVLEHPPACRVEPETLQCKGANGPECLTADQVNAMKSLYDGPRNPRTGEQIFSGWPRGSESAGPSATQGQGLRQIIDLPEPRRSEFWSAFVFHNPQWHWSTLDFDRDLAYANATVGYVSAIEHDLSAFKRRGGKLLTYAGWVDPILPGGDVVHYYERVVEAMGGLDSTRDFSRLFMMPGVGHCSGGPGPDEIDPLAAIRDWVEKGVAPERLIASKRVGGKTVRTRPICAFPRIARWSGTGSTDDAANFTCALP
jgi:feruloyl esterase